MPAEPASRVEPHATCLGCGCACDDIAVRVLEHRIVEADRACALGAAWFGDGRAPARATVDHREVPVDEALSSAAHLLNQASRPLVFLAPDLSMEAQRLAVALADSCGASLDNVSSATVAASILAAQEMGRATATLGEVRNRADVVVFWDVDAARYPRFAERYAPDPPGLYLAASRRGRRVVSVRVGAAASVEDRLALSGADVALDVAPDDEAATLTAVAALLAEPGAPHGDGPAWARARTLADLMVSGRYVVMVADAEPAPGASDASRSSGRAEALWRVSHALNHHTRGGVVTLRAGGNRTGAEAAMTSAAGYPMAVDYGRGVPRYRPHDGTAAALLASGAVDAALVVGDARLIDHAVLPGLTQVPCVALGPGASSGPLAGGRVVIDSARAGVHEGGTALRMDDVPLPLRALVPGPPPARDLLATLAGLVATQRRHPGGAGRRGLL